MRRVLVVLLAVAGLIACAAPAPAAPVVPAAAAQAGPVEVTGFGSNPGSLRMFRYVPAGLPPGRPVVVALHGCAQDAVGYATDVGWVGLADRWGVTLVLPQQQVTNNPALCFDWSDPGSGEDTSILQMVAVSRPAGSPVFVTGLSAGGAMTSELLAAHPDVFSGGAVVAGVPARCADTLLEGVACQLPGRDRTPAEWGDAVRSASTWTGPWPTMSVWHGTLDVVVSPVNLREITEQWTDLHAVPATPTSVDTDTGYPHAVYRDGTGRAVVESWTIPGMGHGQAVDPGPGEAQCGTVAPFVLPTAVCAAYRIGLFWGLPA